MHKLNIKSTAQSLTYKQAHFSNIVQTGFHKISSKGLREK